MNPWRGLFSIKSPAGDAARLSVFIFHRVLPEPDPLFPNAVDVRRFDQIVGWLCGWFNILPLDSAILHLKARTLPARAAAITFDDGYEDNHSLALPVLRRHGVSATFFIATGFLDGGRMWNDSVIESVRRCRTHRLDLGHLELGSHALDSLVARRSAIASIIGQIKYRALEQRHQISCAIADAAEVDLPDDLMMTSSQVRAMHQAGMQIGAHTVVHPILARVGRTHGSARDRGESRRLAVNHWQPCGPVRLSQRQTRRRLPARARADGGGTGLRRSRFHGLGGGDCRQQPVPDPEVHALGQCPMALWRSRAAQLRCTGHGFARCCPKRAIPSAEACRCVISSCSPS